MRRDCFLHGLLLERMRAVATLPWHLEVEDENDPGQKRVRDHLDAAVRATPGYRRIVWQLLEALWYGRYGVQVKWQWVDRRGQKTAVPQLPSAAGNGIASGNGIAGDPASAPTTPAPTPTPTLQPPAPPPPPDIRTLSVRKFEPVNGDKIRYQFDGTPYVTVAGGEEIAGAEYITGTPVGGKGLLLKGSWRQRFLIHAHEQEDSDFFDIERVEAVHGLGIRDRIFWINFMRQEFLAQISDFLGRVGLGITVWYFEYGNDAAKMEAEKAAREQSGKVNIVLPMDSRGKKMNGVERIEVPVSGAQFLDQLIQPFRQDIERYIVGQEGSAKASKSGLSNEASAEFMADTKQQIAMVDADRLEESLTGTADEPGLVWMMQNWTFPGSTPEMGGFRVRWKFDVETKKSEGALAAGKVLWEMGVSLKADEAREKGGFSKPGENDEVIEGKKEPAPAMPPGMGNGGTDGQPPGNLPGQRPPKPPGNAPDETPPPGSNGHADPPIPPAIAARLNGRPAEHHARADRPQDVDEDDTRQRAALIAELLTALYGDDAARYVDELDSGEDDTGRVDHSRNGGALLAYARPWDELKHPRGKGGRFIEKNSAEAVSAAREKISSALKGHRSAESLKTLTEHLSILTTKQLHELKKEHGLKASARVKQELVDKIAAKLGGRQTAAGEAKTIPTSEMHADPERFQYKVSGIGKGGVTEELKGIGKFDPDLAGVVAVWKDPADGKTYVVNGHHRKELADRTGHPEMLVRYLDAKDAKEARAKGAIINIAEGRGSALDAAKFLRDTGRGIDDLKAQGVSVSGRIAADAAALTNLNDRLFGKLAQGEIGEDTALAIGRHLKDGDKQNLLLKIIEKEEDKRRPLAARDIEEMAREMAETPTTTRTEESLFGTDTYEESLFVERAELKAHVRAELAKEVNDWAAVASKRRAGRVSEGGNVLDVDANREQQKLADQARNVFGTLVNRKGPISDSVNAAAENYAAAKTKKQREAIKKQALEGVRDAVKRELGFGDDGAGNTADAGRGVGASVPGGGGVRGGEPGAAEGAADGGGAQAAGTGVTGAAEPGFTGTDANGHEWVNGEQVKKGAPAPETKEGSAAPEPPQAALNAADHPAPAGAKPSADMTDEEIAAERKKMPKYLNDMTPAQQARTQELYQEQKRRRDEKRTRTKQQTNEQLRKAFAQEKYPDGRSVPKVGDDVYISRGGFGGQTVHIRGEVVDKRDGIPRVRITGGATDEHGKVVNLSPDWTRVDDPEIARQKQASKDRELERQKVFANEDAQTAATKKKYGTLTADQVKPGDVLHMAHDPDNEEFAVKVHSIDKETGDITASEPGGEYFAGNVSDMVKKPAPPAATAAAHPASASTPAASHNLASIPIGELRNVGGQMVRRVGEDEYRVDSNKEGIEGRVTSKRGTAEEIARHIEQHARMEGGRRVSDALERVKKRGLPNFTDPRGMAAEESGFRKLPNGTPVVVADEDDPSYGQRGRKVVDPDTGKAHVELENGSKYAGAVEPLDPKLSWRKTDEERAAEEAARPKQASMFSREPSMFGREPAQYMRDASGHEHDAATGQFTSGAGGAGGATGDASTDAAPAPKPSRAERKRQRKEEHARRIKADKIAHIERQGREMAEAAGRARAAAAGTPGEVFADILATVAPAVAGTSNKGKALAAVREARAAATAAGKEYGAKVARVADDAADATLKNVVPPAILRKTTGELRRAAADMGRIMARSVADDLDELADDVKNSSRGSVIESLTQHLDADDMRGRAGDPYGDSFGGAEGLAERIGEAWARAGYPIDLTGMADGGKSAEDIRAAFKAAWGRDVEPRAPGDVWDYVEQVGDIIDKDIAAVAAGLDYRIRKQLQIGDDV